MIKYITLLLLAFGNTNNSKLIINPSAKIENLKIQYHIGYDWRGIYNGKEVRGGKILNQFCEFNSSKNGKYLISRKVKTVNELRNIEEYGFGQNLITDSILIEKVYKKVNLKSIIELISQIEIEESLSKTKFSSEVNPNGEIYSINNEILSFLNDIYNKTKKNQTKQSKDFINCVLSDYENISISSTTQWIVIEFKYNNNKYRLSQQYSGKRNFKWNVTKNNNPYKKPILSPKMNNLVANLLPNKMVIKKSLQEYKKKELYTYCPN